MTAALQANASAGAPLGGAVALFLDVDGTLLDFAQRPDAVITPPELLVSIAAAQRRLDGALALVSGRSLAELDRIFSPLKFCASGVHGAEMRFAPEGPVSTMSEAAEMPESLWQDVMRVTGEFPGTLAENKGFSCAVHFRLAPWSEAPLRAAIEKIVAGQPPGAVEIMDAHFAFDLKRPGPSKGRAIESFLASPPFFGRTPIFLGDDTTDESGFAMVSSRGGFAFAVGELLPGAIGVFDTPGDVRDWLAGFAASEAA